MSFMDMRCPHCGTKMRRLGGAQQYACEACGSIIHIKDMNAASSQEKGREFSYQGSSAGAKTYKGSSQAQKARSPKNAKGKSNAERARYEGSYRKSMEEEKPRRSPLVLLLWILGWILCPPLALLAFIFTRKSPKLRTKFVLILILLGLLMQFEAFWTTGPEAIQNFFKTREIDSVEEFIEEVKELPEEWVEEIEKRFGVYEEKERDDKDIIPPGGGKGEKSFFQYANEVYKQFQAEET